MLNLQNHSIANKISLVFAIILLLVAAMGMMNLYQVRQLNANEAEMIDDWNRMQEASHRIYENLANMRLDIYRFTHVKDPNILIWAKQDIDQCQRNIAEQLAAYDAALVREKNLRPAMAAAEQKLLDEIGIQLYMRGLKPGEQA